MAKGRAYPQRVELYYYFSKTNANGAAVNGHYMRCYALTMAWAGLNHIARDLRTDPPQHPEDAILLVDVNAPFIPQYNYALTVSIADLAPGFVAADIVINHNLDAERLVYDSRYALLGPKFFLRRLEYNHVRPSVSQTVVFAPGGNYAKFWRKISREQAEGICAEAGWELVVAENISPLEFANAVARAGVVVAPASMAALEAISVSKPLLTTITHADQLLNYRGLCERKMALDMTPDNLKKVLDSQKARDYLRQKVAGLVANDGARRCALDIQRIYYGQR